MSRSKRPVLDGVGRVGEELPEHPIFSALGLTVFQPPHVLDRWCTLWTEDFEDLLSSLL